MVRNSFPVIREWDWVGVILVLHLQGHTRESGSKQFMKDWWLQRYLLFKLPWSFQKQKTLFLYVSLMWWPCLTFTKPRTEAVILVPSAQPLKINNLAGEGLRVNPAFPSGTDFSHSGLQNVLCQIYGIVLPAFQPQRPSFPFSPSHSFP